MNKFDIGDMVTIGHLDILSGSIGTVGAIKQYAPIDACYVYSIILEDHFKTDDYWVVDVPESNLYYT